MRTIDEFTIQRFADDIASKGRLASTVESYQRDCTTFLNFVNKSGVASEDLGPSVLMEFQDFLRAKNIKDNSIRRSVIGIRQFFRYVQAEQGWNSNPFEESVIPQRNDDFKPRIGPEQFDQFKNSLLTDGSPLKQARDQVLLSLLGVEGIKVAELINLEWGDFLGGSSQGLLRIKGKRDRTIQIEAETSELLKRFRKLTSQQDSEKALDPRTKIMVGFKGFDAQFMLADLTRHGAKFALYEIGNRSKIPFLNSEDLRHHAMAHKISLGFTPDMLMNHLGLRTPGKASRHFLPENG